MLQPLLTELVDWVRLHEESIVANSATEGMLSGIPKDLRRCLKEQVNEGLIVSERTTEDVRMIRLQNDS